MFPEFIEREGVDIEMTWCGILDDQIVLGIKWKTFDFIELIHAYIASQTLSILHHLTGIIRADARYRLQSCGVSRI